MKKQSLERVKNGAYLSLIILLLFFACTENNNVVKPNQSLAIGDASAEQIGKIFYDHVSRHALEDPMAGVSENDRAPLEKEFNRLKARGSIDAKVILDEALTNGKITVAVHDGILKINQDLVPYVQANPDADLFIKWCQDKEGAVRNQEELTDVEKDRILVHLAIVKNYVLYTLQSLPATGPKSNINSRTDSWKSVLCQLGCAVNNISAFSSVGSLAGTYGTVIGAGVGLLYTIVNSAACNCSSPGSCGAATSISTADVCYSAANGMTFTAWGYGNTPGQFTWDFYREDLSNPPVTRATSGDTYTLTNTELNGASKVAVRVTSNCSGTYFYSQYLWFSPTDYGKPRPSVSVLELGGNQAKYTATGTNLSTYTWQFVPAYRGSLVGGSYSSSTITIQWVSAPLRIGASVTTTSACGSAQASAH